MHPMIDASAAAPMQQQQRPLRFDATPALHAMAVALLAGSIAYSVGLYLSLWVAVPIGLALASAFSTLVQTVFQPAGAVSHGWRLASLVAAAFIFVNTIGLSAATIYTKLFAQDSAVEHFLRVAPPAFQRLETVLGSAQTAAQALAAWSQYSTQRMQQETTAGGSCPARANTRGDRGPVAMFRETEAAMATNLNAALQARVDTLEGQVRKLPRQRPADFEALQRQMDDINAVVLAANALSHGVFVQATQRTLTAQRKIGIEFPGIGSIACGDAARDELIDRTLAALASLATTQELAPLRPAIDLANPQATGIVSLLRSYNVVWSIATVGHGGQFADDPLMVAALAKGIINQETLSLIMASLLELTVVVLAMLAARRGEPAFAFDPAALLGPWEAATRTGGGRWPAALVVLLAKTMVNAFWSRPLMPGATMPMAATGDAAGAMRTVTLAGDWVFPAREVAWGMELLPFLLAVHDGEYLCVPARHLRASMVARALATQDLAELVTNALQLEVVAGFNRSAASRLERLVPDAKTQLWELYRLDARFAQAMRLQMLAPLQPGAQEHSPAAGAAVA